MENDRIEGRNPVMEALRAGRPIDRIVAARGERGLQSIIDAARERGVPVRFEERARVAALARTNAHQGIIAFAAAQEYVEIEDILAAAKERGEKPFIIVLDGICDPHNLGAILRSANGAGAHGVIIPKRGSASLTETVAKTSAGAVEYTPVARVANITSAVEGLKAAGVWVYGASVGEGAKMYYEQDFSGAVALVIGSEGDGISRLVKEKCDFLITIPMRGEIESLNASVAAGILMYEIAKGR